MKVNHIVSQNIKVHRQRARFSQRRLGALCGWTQQYQSQIEAGKVAISVQQLYLIASALETWPGDLLPLQQGDGREK